MTVYNSCCRFKFYTLLLIFIVGLFILFENYDVLKNNLNIPIEERQVMKPNATFRHPLVPPYPYPYKFLINHPEKCLNRQPFLVLLVIGESHDVATRIAIRETWGNESIYGKIEVTTLFLVGVNPVAPDATQNLLEEENIINGDIIQQDFLDTYYNLSLKTLMGMEWLTKFCPNAKYAIKIDNDMFLNVEFLIYQLLRPELPTRENYFSGYIVANTGPLRDKVYKWYVPKEVYPNDTYPPYCSGPGYVFSVDMAKKIYDVAQMIRILPMEDSFMGVCLYELNIPPTKPPNGVFNGHRINYNCCAFNKLITVHHYEKNELRKIWPHFWGKRLNCSS
ncbi:beta-1,3-galactosyltransferase 2 isoform X1 [Bombina bombina]|uniref:beta-1,3-galactosyltransferase 2 isoform X1 n=1 Tax=Bombina bombina TaxID=8345 RepID=UPI00235B29B0|nr:beta-1,3-galactosyltransferase 2 isoform X1 [Bombina bombina]XP_053573875.1 beta-1,3-galactosyltransferase 2 isoform X1 [Bombina bombina]